MEVRNTFKVLMENYFHPQELLDKNKDIFAYMRHPEIYLPCILYQNARGSALPKLGSNPPY